MKRIAIATIAVLLGSHVAAAPLRYEGPGLLVIVQSGNTRIEWPKGRQRIGDKAKFDCSSHAGCAVIATGHVSYDGQNCFRVDGPSPPAIPSSCWSGDPDHRSVFTVPYGSHAIWLSVKAPHGGGVVAEWETDYSIYALSPTN